MFHSCIFHSRFFSAPNYTNIAYAYFTQPTKTRTRQDCLVLSLSAMWIELATRKDSFEWRECRPMYWHTNGRRKARKKTIYCPKRLQVWHCCFWWCCRIYVFCPGCCADTIVGDGLSWGKTFVDVCAEYTATSQLLLLFLHHNCVIYYM